MKRQDSLHTFDVPRLLKSEWFCLLYKAADIVFDIPVGSKCWPTHMYEALRIGIAFAYFESHSGSFEARLKCSTWEGSSEKCGAVQKWTCGTLCTNFY